MKKLTLLCIADDREKTLKKLSELGVVHLEHMQTPEGDDINEARAKVSAAENALNAIKPYISKDLEQPDVDGDTAVERIQTLTADQKKINDNTSNLLKAFTLKAINTIYRNITYDKIKKELHNIQWILVP